MRKDKGVISVFLALIFGILFTFFCVTIDITRINSAKNHLIVAADAAITSVLSNFDTDLYESYGIMTFDKSEVDEGSVKETVDANITDNSLLNIKVDEVEVEAGGSPFTNNDIMKKQMIHSMKYQGTENLARSVFDKLKEILKIKDMAEDQEKIEKFENEDKTKERIDKELAVVEQAKVDAHKAILELAINSPFKELTTVDMGYIYNSVDKNMLSNIKAGKSALDYAKKALANTKIYKNNNNVYKDIKSFKSCVHNKYSYFYSKMILEMYYVYAEKVHKENVSNNENNDTSQDEVTLNIKTPTPQSIRYKISQFKNDYDNIIKSQSNKLIKNLEDLQSWEDKKFIFITKDRYGVKEAIESLNYLIDNNANHLKLLRENYTNLKTDDAKESGEQSLKTYEELLDINKLKSYKAEFVKINNHINSVIENIKMIDSMNNLMIKYAKEWAAENTNSDLFTLLDEQIGKSITFASMKSISQNKTIMNHSAVRNILNKDQYQVETLKGLELSSTMDIEPMHKDADKFIDFVKSFKNKIGMDSKDKSISAVIDRHLEERGTSDNLSRYNLPSNTNDDKIESLAQGLGNISTDDIISLNNFGDLLKLADQAAGGLLDNAYLVEYVMTNFKDMIGDTNSKRIPEVTDNDTKLGFEIEYIISGKYTDKKNSKAMADELMLKRTSLNAITLSSNKQPRIKGFINRAAIAISTATQGTLPIPIVKTILIGGWSALEARYDVIDLLNGKEAPVLKDGREWVTDFGLSPGDFNLNSQGKSDNDEMNKLAGTISKIDLDNPASKKEGADAYNSQDSNMALDYIDFVRLRLLTMNKDKLIDRCQNLISANQDISEHEKYSTDLEVTINKSNVNILFNTPAFSSNGGVNNFNSFSFKRGYN